MNKFFSFLMILLFSAVLCAEEDTLGDKLYVQIEAGIGADFTGTPGRISDLEDYMDYDRISHLADALMKNQFGVSLGLDFNWRLFQKTSGEGAGELYFGFGFDLQYWAPTSKVSNAYIRDYYYNDEEKHNSFLQLHYMRVPVMLNVAYDFKVNAGKLRRVGPKFSAGINNNFFILEYDYNPDDEDMEEDFEQFADYIEFHKLSFSWSLGLNLVFSNRCFWAVSIGGDKGSEKIKYYLFRPDSGRMLYNHHEFIMFETGYRF
ncbi:hypothetical protein J5681_07100 [bacterium]|nr:hypothetical protein [bacterium]